MTKRVLCILAAIMIISPAYAAEPLPGEGCSAANNLQFTSGPEVAGGGGHAMLCQGGTWKSILSFNDAAGLTTLGNQTCAANEILKFNGTTWACAADATGSLDDDSVTNAKMADAAIGITELSASGTASATTYLRGDNTWATVSSSLPALTSASIWVGDASNAATAVAMSGDATLSNVGVLNLSTGAIIGPEIADGSINSARIGDGTITGADIAGATIPVGKISATGTPGATTYLRGDGTWTAVSGGGGGSLPTCPAGDTLTSTATGTWVCTTVYDAAPTAFLFSNNTGVALSTLTESNIVQVTGISESIAVTLSSSADNRQYRICNDATCSSVDHNWTSSAGAIDNGQYLQLRLTSDAVNASTRQSSIQVGTYSPMPTWKVVTIGYGPSNCPNIGDLCSDGTYYVGQTTSGNISLFAKASDESGQKWATAITDSRGAIDDWAGAKQSAKQATYGNGAGQLTHPAALQCANSTAHGYNDWYLPAANELNMLYTMVSTFGQTAGLNTSGTYYWSSSEYSGTPKDYAKAQRFNDGTINSITSKTTSLPFRCVRAATAFGFTDESDAAVSTLTLSNTVIVTGVASGTNVTITGDGSPQFRVAGGAWGTTGTIDSGQSLQLRLTSPASSNSASRALVTVGTVAEPWVVSTVATDCPSLGDLCAGGTIYLGDVDYGSGNEKIYVADVNQNATGTGWGASGESINPDSDLDGRVNYANRIMPIAGAFALCEDLDRHGKQDWYLPAKTEMTLLYTNRTAVNLRSIEPMVSTNYWSSTESATTGYAFYANFIVGGCCAHTTKSTSQRVRCVRRD